MKKIIGYFLLSLPFVAIFIIGLIALGLIPTLAIWGIVGIILLCVHFGVILID